MSKPKFYLIVAGGRDYNNSDKIMTEILKLTWNELKNYDVEIIHGGARGADQAAGIAAANAKMRVHVCPAEWDKYGNSAGPIRNRKMGEVAHGLLAFWDGESKGTKHMIDFMKSKGKSVRIINY